ncbi:cupin domain-containing protein [Chitinilyticum litopenaei]|uniref:cupin domain-containing protein n=1 Tax=Chitinilyticum litopenaei TaxID=1121276 RepID=UPI000416ECF3|nr:cupin domain-containing protein [Chitinilyticum litopenaei]
MNEAILQASTAETGPHFSASHVGPMAELARYRFRLPALGNRPVPGKVFLREALHCTGVELSLNSLPPGAGVPFLHAHRENEEIYVFTRGSGEFQVDGQIFPVGEGSLVRVAPAGRRAFRNTGEQALEFTVLQVRAGSMNTATTEDGYLVQEELRWAEA